MLITDKFVFLDLPWAGGTFGNEAVRKLFPSARETGYHLPRQLLPRDLPVLAVIQNPWEFYVSWYHHHRFGDRCSPFKNALFRSLSEDGKSNFVQTIRNALNLGVSDDNLDFLIAALPEKPDYHKSHIPNLTRDFMAKIRGTGLGLCTFQFNQMFGQSGDVFFCHIESLRQDLLAFFETIGVASDTLRGHVRELDTRNIPEHRHYSTFYTPELAALVAIRDRRLVERFGFAFESHTAEYSRVKFERPARRAIRVPAALGDLSDLRPASPPPSPLHQRGKHL
jgi:hypothetical protein